MRYLVSEDIAVREGLVRAPGARLEPARAAGASRARERRVAGGPDRRRSPSRASSTGSRCRSRRSSRSSITFNEGIMLERLSGVTEGHKSCSTGSTRWLSKLTRPQQRASRRARATRTPTGYVERDGVRVFYEVYGEGEPTVLLLPTWSIIHSRHWKMQIPYLARHCRVRHVRRARQRPLRPAAASEAYAEREFAADALAVMDATGTERAVLVSLSRGAAAGAAARRRATRSGSTGIVFIAPALPLGDRPAVARQSTLRRTSSTPTRAGRSTTATTGCATTPASSSSSSRRCFTEPHSTKQIEDCVGWGLETDAETLIATQLAPTPLDEAGDPRALRAASAARCS